MKKYKLLKDLPGYDAGTIFFYESQLGYRPQESNLAWHFYLPSACVEKLSDWFEEMQEQGFTQQDMVDFASHYEAVRYIFCDKAIKSMELDKQPPTPDELLSEWIKSKENNNRFIIKLESAIRINKSGYNSRFLCDNDSLKRIYIPATYLDKHKDRDIKCDLVFHDLSDDKKNYIYQFDSNPFHIETEIPKGTYLIAETR